MDLDPDPVGPKTCGSEGSRSGFRSGSGTLVSILACSYSVIIYVRVAAGDVLDPAHGDAHPPLLLLPSGLPLHPRAVLPGKTPLPLNNVLLLCTRCRYFFMVADPHSFDTDTDTDADADTDPDPDPAF